MKFLPKRRENVKKLKDQLHDVKVLATFSYKGVDKFVLRTDELVPLAAMLQSAKRELDDFYKEEKPA